MSATVLLTGERTVFASQSADFDGEVSVGRYAVDPAAIERGLALATREGDALVIDEIGKLERRGEGFAPLLESLDPARYRGILLSVRKGVVPFVADHFPADADLERVSVTESSRNALVERIATALIGDGGRGLTTSVRRWARTSPGDRRFRTRTPVDRRPIVSIAPMDDFSNGRERTTWTAITLITDTGMI